jgi:hypothetical protein
MIITPLVENDNLLNLLAYSYQDREFEIVDSFFLRQSFQFKKSILPLDADSRMGKQYSIATSMEIKRFEKILGITFTNKGEQTSIESATPSDDAIPYRCLRIKDVAWQQGCASIMAPDDSAAFILCAMTAKKLKWFGGKAEKGFCK